MKPRKRLILMLFFIALLNSCNNKMPEKALKKHSVDSTMIPFYKAASYMGIKDTSGWKLSGSAFVITDTVVVSKETGVIDRETPYNGQEDYIIVHEGDYAYQKVNCDTLSRLTFSYTYYSDTNAYYIVEPIYLIKYDNADEETMHIVRLGRNLDTLYHYKKWIFGRDFIRFVGHN